MTKYSLAILAFLLCLTVNAQDSIVITKGRVTENIKINKTDLTYSLYLPASYSPEKKYPVIFALDPDGDAIRTARLFTAATGALDFIVAANEFKFTDSTEVNITNTMEMMNHVILSVSTDQDQFYVSGLNEGGVVASSISYVVAGIAGTLPINDVFFKVNFLALKNRGFVSGLVANASVDYYKMVDAFDNLAAAKSENKLYKYPEADGWPITSVLSTAISNLYFLRNDQLGKELPEKTIEATLNADLSTAQYLIQNRHYLIAENYIKDFKDKYRNKHDLDTLRYLLRDLRDDPGFKTANKTAEGDEYDEFYLLEDLTYFLSLDVGTANFENLAYWDQKIQDLEAAAQNAYKSSEAIVAQRLLGFLNASVKAYIKSVEEYNTPTSDSSVVKKKESIDKRMYPHILMTFLQPDNADSYMRLISLAAEDNDSNTAYFYLEELLRTGYRDYDAIYEIPETDVIKISPAYNEIVKTYFFKSKYQ